MTIKEKRISCGHYKASKKRQTCAYYRLCQSHSLLSAEIISFPFLRETEIKLLADSENWLKLFNNCTSLPSCKVFTVTSVDCKRHQRQSKWQSDKERGKQSSSERRKPQLHLDVLIRGTERGGTEEADSFIDSVPIFGNKRSLQWWFCTEKCAIRPCLLWCGFTEICCWFSFTFCWCTQMLSPPRLTAKFPSSLLRWKHQTADVQSYICFSF